MIRKYLLKALRVFLGAAVFVLLVTPNITAETKGDSAKDEKQQQVNKEETPSLSGAKYARDKDGAIRQTTDKENREFSSKIRQTLRKYPRHDAKIDKKGGISLVVAPYNFRWSVATVGEDGKVQYHCADSPSKVDTAVNKTAESNLEKE